MEPSDQDVVVAMLGATAAIGGFVLVFLGVLISNYRSLGPDHPEMLYRMGRTSILFVVAVFSISLINIALDWAWLLAGGGNLLYTFCVALFAAQLTALGGVAGMTAWDVIQHDTTRR